MILKSMAKTIDFKITVENGKNQKLFVLLCRGSVHSRKKVQKTIWLYVCRRKQETSSSSRRLGGQKSKSTGRSPTDQKV